MKYTKFVSKYLNEFKTEIFIFSILSLIISTMGILIPLITGNFIDYLLSNPTMNTIAKFIVLFVMFAFVQVICSFNFNVISAKIQSNISYQIISDVIDHIQNCSLKKFNYLDPTYTIERILNDVKMIVNSIQFFLSGFLSNTLIFLFCFYVILTKVPIIAICQLILIVTYYFIFKYIRPLLIEVSVRLKEESAHLISNLQNQIKNIKFIKAYNIFEYSKNKADSIYKKLYYTNIRYCKLNFILGGTNITSLFLQLLLFYYGGYLIISNRMTIGLFTVLISYLNTTNKTIEFFMNLNSKIVDFKLSIDRILHFFKTSIDTEGSIQLENIDNIQIQSLFFQYKNEYVIKDFSYEFTKGKIYQIVGKNGCGKTTLIMLMIGMFLGDYEGKILFNHININDINMKSVRDEKISIMFQDDYILPETLEENIVFNKKYDLRKNSYLINLMSKLCILDFYKNKDLCLNKLSGGEIRKIEFIRFLIKYQSDLIILDEPTTYLDNEAKNILFDYLNKNKKNKIIILISHENIFDNLVDETIYL